MEADLSRSYFAPHFITVCMNCVWHEHLFYLGSRDIESLLNARDEPQRLNYVITKQLTAYDKHAR